MRPNISAMSYENHDPQQVGDLPVITERERYQALYEWNDTGTYFPDACVHELFELQVCRDPDAVAIVCQGRQLSYRELNERANQVGRYLQKRGVRPETLVGVCMERSPEMVVALLGVWKAGGAYLPLDPAYPRERLSFMMRDAGVKFLLTDENCKNLIPSANGSATCLNSDWPEIARENTSNLAAALPSNLAYVIYTSGSTGQPKGVMIQHCNLANYLCWAIKFYAVAAGGSVPIHTSIAFDSTVASLYPPLLSGGKIELLPEDVGGQRLLAALRSVKYRRKVVITPPHPELLNHQLAPGEMIGMTRVLVVAGEKLLGETLAKWRNLVPPTRLINEYGPTEATVGCCAYEVLLEDPTHGPVPIGRPIANAQLYVLGPNLEPVPPGVSGELYIGGAGVARCYLNRPELTRERFIPDPFSGRSGARLYKTGDIARHRKDGTLEFLGRADDQVKVRGRRIELGEIEAILAGHPGVLSCTVLAREDTPGNNRLVGYVTAQEGISLETKGLQAFLMQRLPDYMVPTQFIYLESFPLTWNGKIDRKALPAPSYKNTMAPQKFVPPRTATEKKLAAIWMKLLKLERIGIHDDIFELGGDSLLATQAMLQIREAFGVFLSMQTLFPSATVAGIAKELSGREEFRNRLAYAVPVQPEGNRPPFFWMGGTVSRQFSAHLGSNQPFYGIGIEPKIIETLKAPYRMEELAKHLVLAIREKQHRGPYYLGGFCQDAPFAYEVARELTMHGQTAGLLALLEPEYPRRNVRVRIAFALRRKFFRAGIHLYNLRQLGNSGFPLSGRNQWGYLQGLISRIWGRMFDRFRSSKTHGGPQS